MSSERRYTDTASDQRDDLFLRRDRDQRGRRTARARTRHRRHPRLPARRRPPRSNSSPNPSTAGQSVDLHGDGDLRRRRSRWRVTFTEGADSVGVRRARGRHRVTPRSAPRRWRRAAISSRRPSRDGRWGNSSGTNSGRASRRECGRRRNRDVHFRCRAGRLGARIERDREHSAARSTPSRHSSALRIGDDNEGQAVQGDRSPSTRRPSPTARRSCR